MFPFGRHAQAWARSATGEVKSRRVVDDDYRSRPGRPLGSLLPMRLQYVAGLERVTIDEAIEALEFSRRLERTRKRRPRVVLEAPSNRLQAPRSTLVTQRRSCVLGDHGASHRLRRSNHGQR